MEITKREIIASIAIIAVMLTIGFIISGKITEHQIEKNAEYQKAVHIEDKELFEYGMRTNVGNAFVYGDIKPVDTVTYEEIGGEYLHVEKIEERYERHEKWVTEKNIRKKKVWYEWETENRESKRVKEIEFLGVKFDYGKINLPGKEYIDTINSGRVYSWQSGERVKVRFKYYGVTTEHTGTIYTRLADDTISDNSRFFEDYTIDEALEICTSGAGDLIFWILWIVLIFGCVYGFYYAENRWLE